MIDIASLSPGDIVRNIGSGNAYTVADDPSVTVKTGQPFRWSAPLVGGIECSNPHEWELLAKGPWVNSAAIGETIGGEYAIEVSIGDRTVRYSAPSAEGVAELMRVDSDHVMGAR